MAYSRVRRAGRCLTERFVGGREEAASSQVARVGLRRYGHSGREVITGRIAADTGGTARAAGGRSWHGARVQCIIGDSGPTPPREATLFGQDAAAAVA
jgi:hypothetical protein